jgi:16S rRNA (uracil1498-N3)-methyltransferase
MIEPRFYAPTLDATASELRLEGDEGHHLMRVLRLGAGARIRVFDGRGVEVRAEIVSATKSAVVTRIIEPAIPAPEPPVAITLAQAVLKGDSMDQVVRDATMMGVRIIQPVVSERTIVPARALDASAFATRWHRVAVASAKQCGRAVVPTIMPARRVSELVGEPADGCRCLLLEPSALEGRAPSDPPAVAPRAATVLVGPEGGWTPAEVTEALGHGWLPWSLGALTLRAEAAPLASLAVLRWIWRKAL